MARRRSRSPLSRALFGITFAAVLLMMGEVGLRLSGVQPAYRVEELGRWRFNANLVDQEMQGPKDGHSFKVSTNADGLRTSLTRGTPTKKRIALMGDSTVFGWGVNDGGTLADGMQAKLPDTEILNAGQPGYSTTMAAWFFEEVVAEYQPTWTIIFIPMHDTNRVLVSDQELLSGGATTGDRMRVWLSRESRLYSVLRKLVFPYTEQAWLMPGQVSTEPRVPRVSDTERTAALNAMRRTMSGWGGQLIIGYLPFKGDIEDGSPSDRPTTQWARGYGVGLIELQSCCRGETGLVLVDDPGHLSEAGNLRVGGVLGERMGEVLGR